MIAGETTDNMENEKRKFACPIFKNNPVRYAEEMSMRFGSIGHVRQHVKHNHCRPKLICTRCNKAFLDDEELQHHRQCIPPCVVDHSTVGLWLDKSQEELSQARIPRLSGQEAQWRWFYQKLFPQVDDCDVPSPFYESREAQLRLLSRHLFEEGYNGEPKGSPGHQPPLQPASSAAKSTLKQTGEDCITYTDSGYESAEGLLYPSLREDILEETHQIENGHTHMTGGMDVNDDDTSYSVATVILPEVAENCVIDVCDNIKSRLQGSVSKGTFKSLSEILPGLMKAFALKLGSDMSDQSNLRVMHFVHKHHKYIVSHLQREFQCDESESRNPRKSMDAMPLDEIMSKWRDSDDKEVMVVDPSECFQGLSDENDDGEGESGDEEGDVTALTGYSKMIVNSTAYDWLITSMVKEASFHWGDAHPHTMVDQIRQEILSHLPTGRISSKRPPNQHTVSFKMPRSSLPFLSENIHASPTRNPATVIADRIVAISSSSNHVQLSNLSQYMEQTWSSGASALLSLLQNFINGLEQAMGPCILDGNVKIELLLKGVYLEAVITGTSYSIAEYGEQLAWLTAALQAASFDHSIYVMPFIRRVEHESPTRGAGNSWVIGHWREKLDDADVTTCIVQEWQSEFKSPVIVRGFPTLSRPEDCPGIEIPPQLSASLLLSPLKERDGTRVLLKTTGKLLQLFDQTNGVAVWHIIKSPIDPCACRRRFMQDDDKDTNLYLNSFEIRQHRHIITECSISQMHYEEKNLEMKPEIGGPEIPQRECSLLDAPQFTPYSGDATYSPDSLDLDMLSIPDSSEDGADGPPGTDDAILAIMEVVASRLASEYRQCTAQHNPANECPSNTKQCSPGGQQSFATHGSSHSTFGRTTTQAGSTIPVRKRPTEQDDDDGDEDSRRRPARKKKKGDSIEGPQFFACPFWKQNPGKHSNCFGKKLNMISRVKQHLTRSHAPEFYCEKCLVVFPNEEGKLTHFREELYLCTFQRSRPLEGITNEQQRKLSRKSDKSLSEYEKWFVVWDIVFPGHDRPSSPYLDLELSRDLNHFREFSERRGVAVLVEVMCEEGLVTLEGDEANSIAQRAANRAMRSLFDEWVGQRAESSRYSRSGESSSTDSMGEQQYQGQQHERLQRFADLSPNADSGVELRSYPSSGPSRDGTNLTRFTSIQPRLTSDRGPQIVAPAMVNPYNDTIHVPSTDPNHWHPFVEPVPIETAHIDTATQSGEDQFDLLSLNSDSGDLELGFDLDDYFMNPDESGLEAAEHLWSFGE